MYRKVLRDVSQNFEEAENFVNQVFCLLYCYSMMLTYTSHEKYYMIQNIQIYYCYVNKESANLDLFHETNL